MCSKNSAFKGQSKQYYKGKSLNCYIKVKMYRVKLDLFLVDQIRFGLVGNYMSE